MKLDAIVSAMFSLVIIAGVWCHFSPWLTVFPTSVGRDNLLERITVHAKEPWNAELAQS